MMITYLICLLFLWHGAAETAALSNIGNTLKLRESLNSSSFMLSASGEFMLRLDSSGLLTLRSITYNYTVWVANIDYPIYNTSSAFLTLVTKPTTSLKLGFWDRDAVHHYMIFYRSHVNRNLSTNVVATLTDSGNFVLQELQGGTDASPVLWQSFDETNGALYPEAQFRGYIYSNWEQQFPTNIGYFALRWDPATKKLKILYVKEGNMYERWNSGELDTSSYGNFKFVNIPHDSKVHYSFSADNSYYFRYSVYGDYNEYVRSALVLGQDGELYDVYNNISLARAGDCDGFNTDGGCERWGESMTIDYCDSKLSGTNDSVVRKHGYFTPISFNTSINTSWVSSYLIREDCMPTCLMNCDCLGYEFLPNQTGCRYWNIHHSCFHEEPTISTIYFVLPRKIRHITKRTNDGMHRWMKIGISVAIVLLALVLCSMCYLIQRRKLAGENQKKIQDLLNMMNSNRHILNDGNRGHDLCVFKYASILAATRNFSDENKLGQGGFGSVYKGRLVTGEEVAIKRLSKCSKQGISEFKNELMLIYELQHKNLVQLFGFCIHGEEKMLIYEYLPNKSLDYFLFDDSRCAQLDWNKHFCIIEGIAQGLLYLHIYSRTRIVHRDLKASNVLLDERMQPKISDFGLARIFSNDEEEANTLIIAGTRAYMPPEYIIGGNFSTKSDVYSFGVLMLEILSGRKNNSFYNNDRALNLVGYAWMLWKQDAGLGLVDPTIGDSCNEEKSLRCIQVALLCVEEIPADRPTMLDVMSMLTNESMTLPTPTKPAFCTERNVTSAAAVNGTRQEIVVSVNSMSISNFEGR